MKISRRSFVRAVSAVSASALLPFPFRTFAKEGPVVKTSRGAVRGLASGGVHVFRGVPCGKNPYVGSLRLAAPEYVDAWSGVVDAVTPGDVPLQFSRDFPGGVKGGGDCLRLNIWTPEPGAAKCPVMVWIPGGGSMNCDNNDPRFDGTAFARDGVVLVTINYRVNVDGFLKIPGAPANIALRDMLFALRWVRENIAAFGGDPDNVTVFGQSAGATHITSLLASPLAQGLFRRAILQSPAALAQYDPETADRVAAQMFAFYGVEPSRAAVAAMPFEKLVTYPQFTGPRATDDAWAELTGGNVAVFKPWYDGEVLTMRPVDAVRQGCAKDVDILVGSAEDEWRHYTVPGGAIAEIGPDAAERLVRSAHLAPDLAEQYRKAGRGETPGELFTALQGDFIFRMPANKVLESQTDAGGRAWAYSFGWKSPVKGKSGAELGAAHSCDVPFVFKTVEVSRRSLGDNPPPALAAAMHAAWVNFAREGTPGWTPFDTEKRMTMVFNENSREVSDPWKFEREAMRLG